MSEFLSGMSRGGGRGWDKIRVLGMGRGCLCQSGRGGVAHGETVSRAFAQSGLGSEVQPREGGLGIGNLFHLRRGSGTAGMGSVKESFERASESSARDIGMTGLYDYLLYIAQSK